MNTIPDDGRTVKYPIKGEQMNDQTKPEDVRYYEWNASKKTWVATQENDPPPPPHLRPGRFDGEIAEVRPSGQSPL